MEELRGGYEKAKAENIKVKDNIETQNKLWKIWLKKFEDKPEEANEVKDIAEKEKAYLGHFFKARTKYFRSKLGRILSESF